MFPVSGMSDRPTLMVNTILFQSLPLARSFGFMHLVNLVHGFQLLSYVAFLSLAPLLSRHVLVPRSSVLT